MTKKLFSFLPLFFIVLVAFIIRFVYIESVAPGISTDEVDYSLNAKSFFFTGKDLGNSIHVIDLFKFKYPSTDSVKAELPYVLLMPFNGPFAFSLLLTRLLYVVMSVGSVGLLYGITKLLLGRRTGIIVGLLAAINPYLIVIGRTTYEVNTATFFFLLGFYLLLKARGYKILLTFPIFMCAFYAYIGTKLLFVPFVLLSCFFCYLYIQKKKERKYYVMFSALTILFVGIYLLFLHLNQTGARFNQLLTLDTPRIVQTVDSLRKVSLFSPLNDIIINKFTVYGQIVIGNFFPIFSFDYLLMTGDGFFRLYNHGVFYYIDSIFLLLGLVYLFRAKKNLGLFLIGFIIVSTFPQVFFNSQGTAPNYAHAVLVFPFLLIIVAAGIASLDQIPSRILKKNAILITFCVYVISTAFFIQTYFLQYPLHGYDDYPTRLLSRYLVLATNERKPVIVMSPVSLEHFKKYLFYSNTFNRKTVNDVKKAFISGNMSLGQIQFTSCSQHPVFPANTIVIEDTICGNSDFMSHTSIPLILDGGTYYKIYQDSICKTYNLKRYPTGLTLSDLNVEKLSKKKFCEDFITY